MSFFQNHMRATVVAVAIFSSCHVNVISSLTCGAHNSILCLRDQSVVANCSSTPANSTCSGLQSGRDGWRTQCVCSSIEGNGSLSPSRPPSLYNESVLYALAGGPPLCDSSGSWQNAPRCAFACGPAPAILHGDIGVSGKCLDGYHGSLCPPEDLIVGPNSSVSQHFLCTGGAVLFNGPLQCNGLLGRWGGTRPLEPAEDPSAVSLSDRWHAELPYCAYQCHPSIDAMRRDCDGCAFGFAKFNASTRQCRRCTVQLDCGGADQATGVVADPISREDCLCNCTEPFSGPSCGCNGTWSDWDLCPRACGGGTQTRSRSVWKSSVRVCVAETTTRVCNTAPCPCLTAPSTPGLNATDAVQCAGTHAGASCTARCYAPFVLSGSFQCATSGVAWQSPGPTCDAVPLRQPCYRVPSIPDVNVTTLVRCAGTPAGTACATELQCLGPRLPSSRLVCSEDGAVFSSIPTCLHWEACTARAIEHVHAASPQLNASLVLQCFGTDPNATCGVPMQCTGAFSIESSAPSYLTCGSDGLFRSPLPRCVANAPCSTVPVIPFASKAQLQACVGTIAGRSCDILTACDTGVLLNGTLHCSEDGSGWQLPLPSCYPAPSCVVLPEVSNVLNHTLQLCNGTRAGMSCPYLRCRVGYSLVGTLVCSPYGTHFQTPLPVCMANPPCDSVVAIAGIDEGSLALCKGTPAGASCSHLNASSCGAGASLNGELRCRDEGTLFGSVPMCVDLPVSPCYQVDNIGNSIRDTLVACNGTRAGMSCPYLRCRVGYSLVGTLVCSPYGTHFQTPLPVCMANPPCGSVVAIAGIDEGSLALCKGTPAGASCSHLNASSCGAGASLNGELRCRDEGTSFGTLPICIYSSMPVVDDHTKEISFGLAALVLCSAMVIVAMLFVYLRMRRRRKAKKNALSDNLNLDPEPELSLSEMSPKEYPLIAAPILTSHLETGGKSHTLRTFDSPHYYSRSEAMPSLPLSSRASELSVRGALPSASDPPVTFSATGQSHFLQHSQDDSPSPRREAPSESHLNNTAQQSHSQPRVVDVRVDAFRVPVRSAALEIDVSASL